MRILIVENIPRYGGGCETMSLQMGMELAQRGHEIYLAHEADGSMLETYRTFASEIIHMDLTLFGWRKLKDAVSSIRKLAKEIRKRDIDLIFTSHLGHLRGLGLLRKAYGIPSVFYLGLPPRDLQGPKAQPLDWSRRQAVKNIYAGVACSNWIAGMWKQAGWPATSMHVVPHWIDAEKFKPAPNKEALRLRLNLPAKTPLVLYVGRVVEDKGVEVLLEAFSKTRAEVADAELVIAGPVAAEYSTRLRTVAADFRAGHSVHIVGPGSNAQDYFAATDLAVVPSLVQEAFGIVAIEAMSCGAVTLVSSSGELPAVLGDGYRDLVFESGNSDDLAGKMKCWLKDRRGATLRAGELRQHALHNYTRDGKLDVYEGIMKSACGLVDGANVGGAQGG